MGNEVTHKAIDPGLIILLAHITEKDQEISRLDADLRKVIEEVENLNQRLETCTKTFASEKEGSDTENSKVQLKLAAQQNEISILKESKQNLCFSLNSTITKTQDLEAANNQFKADLESQKSELFQIKNKFENLLKVKEDLTKTDQELREENKKLEQQLLFYKELSLKFENKIIEFEEKSAKSLAEEEKLQKEIGEMKEQQNNKEVCSEKVPSLSIKMDSFLDLNDPKIGWRFESPNPEKLKDSMDKKRVTLAVIGMCDVGKSWLCNKFTGKNDFNSGYNQRTDGLNFSFPEEDGTLVAVIDMPGSNEAIRVSDPKLFKKIASANQQKIGDGAKNQIEDEYMQRYKILKNDAKMLQNLKEKFCCEIADVVVVVCNKLSEKEQENVYKLIKHHKAICCERMREAHRTSGEYRETCLYVVHNYKMLTEIEQVEKQIERDLKNSFDITDTPLFSSTKQNFIGCNLSMFKDQFGVGHLILAAHGSNAGKYYNPSTFGFFRDKIRVMDNHTSANVKDLFLKFCNKNLPKMLKQEELKVKFDACGEVIIKEGESKIILENLRYDKFGDFVVSSSFEPRYSVTEKILDSEIKEITVDVELLDAQYKSTFLKDSEGQWCLVIKGTKMTSIKKDAKTKEIVIESNREQGNFTLVVRLPKGQKTEYSKKDLENGIVRYTINLSENSEKDID